MEKINNYENVMKTIWPLIILGMLSGGQTALAHPPSEMSLNYIHEKEVLRVDMTHASHDIKDHYIRKIYIFKNDEKPTIVYLTRQGRPNKAIEDILIKSDSNDVIRVKVFCSKGGFEEETITVPEPEVLEETEEFK
jgi:hypothetical protein